MNLLLAGVSHRTASLEIREQLAIPPRELSEMLRALRLNVGAEEAVILSTCNRVELYLATANPITTLQQLVDFLALRSRLCPQAIQSRLYRFIDREAVRHLLRVVSGLDSMVLGESEITAQVKQAYQLAQAQDATGPLLDRLFQKALHAPKVLRSQTRIAEGQASIGSVVVSLARQIFKDDLKRCEVLLWGAGKAAEATARHLHKNGVQQLWIVNRTQLKAQDLATLCQSGWLSWEQALKHLAHVDIAIVCTQAPHHVIDGGDLDAISEQRQGRPLCLIDLAVPRNVDPALKHRVGLILYNIDDLQVIAQRSMGQRQQTVARCEQLVQEQANHFMQWWDRRADEEAMQCDSLGALPLPSAV